MIVITRFIPVTSIGGPVAVVVVLARAVVKCGCLHLKVMDDHRGFKGKATCYCRAWTFLLVLTSSFQTVSFDPFLFLHNHTRPERRLKVISKPLRVKLRLIFDVWRI